MARRSRVVIVDDRLLIEELLIGLRPTRAELYTTAYWYYRACRAAVLGAGGRLSGPFEELDPVDQGRGVASLLELREDISLPDPRSTVPVMVEIASRHPRLNLLNLEAVAAGRLLGATLLLSVQTQAGVLPSVLDQEGVSWRLVPLD